MTSGENLRRLMAGSGYRRVAFHDNIWSDTLSRWVGEGYPVLDGVPMDPVDGVGFDMVMVGGIDSLPLRGGDRTVEEGPDWVVRRNGAGACLRFWKRRSGAPEHLSFAMTDRHVWEREYRPHLLALDPQRFHHREIARAYEKARSQELFLCFHNAFLWETMRDSLGDLCMLESMCSDPGWIHDYNRVYTDFYTKHYEELFRQYGLPDGISVSEDLAYTKGLFCSVRMLGDLFLPYYREVTSFFHSHGLNVTIHSDGDIRDAIPLLIEAGFDAINPMEVKSIGDPLLLADRYASRIAFKGGLDARVLETGDRNLIRREVERLVRGMKSRGARYIFGSDHSVPSTVSWADFCFAVEVYRRNAEYGS